MAKERLDLCVLLLSDLKPGETSDRRKAAIDALLSQWPSTPFPSLELVLSKHALRRVVDSLKLCASAETLSAEMERAWGGINCWSLVQSSAKTALLEVQKAVKDTVKREKKRAKDIENKQKKADAKKRKEEEKKAAQASLGDGPGGQGHPFWTPLFDLERHERVSVLTRAALKSHSPMHAVLVEDPLKLSDSSFSTKAQLFLEQFAGSTPARTTGRTFLRVGQQARDLDSYYKNIVRSSQPLVPREDCAKMFQTQFVGVAAGQMTFALLDAPVLRHGLQSEIFMAIVPIDACIKVMKEFGAEGDVAKIAARAMEKNANLLDGASKKLRKVKMAQRDLVYIPPMSAVWERTISATAFLQFKWIPAATADWSDMAKETLALEGWSSSDLFKKQRASFQRILEQVLGRHPWLSSVPCQSLEDLILVWGYR